MIRIVQNYIFQNFIEIVNQINFSIFTLAVESLKCWTCTYGKCLIGINYYGVEKTCKGYQPVCVKKETQEKIGRTCQSSNAYIYLRSLDSKCIEYNGVKLCYFKKDNCNQALQLIPATKLLNILLLWFNIIYRQF